MAFKEQKTNLNKEKKIKDLKKNFCKQLFVLIYIGQIYLLYYTCNALKFYQQ